MSEDVVEQQLDYPDDNYEGGLGVDEKEPELKWAVAGHSAVPELFNWLGRKTTEDIQKIRTYLAQLESVRQLSPMSELTPTAGKEPDIIYTNGYGKAYLLRDSEENEVGGVTSLLRTEPEIHLLWSMQNITDGTDPVVSVDIDIFGESDNMGEDIISATQTLSVPTQPDVVQRSIFDLGDVSVGEDDKYEFDEVRGKAIAVYINRSPASDAQGHLSLHGVEVR